MPKKKLTLRKASPLAAYAIIEGIPAAEADAAGLVVVETTNKGARIYGAYLDSLPANIEIEE